MTYLNLISDGSSSMVVNGPTDSWMEYYRTNLSIHTFDALHNQAAGGSVLADLVSRLSSVTPNLHSGWWNCIICQIGANDLLPAQLTAAHGSSVMQWGTTVLSDYLIPLSTIIRSTGLIMCTTIQPRDVTGFNANRNTGNLIIRSWAASGYIDGVIDMAADPVMGPDAACNDLTLYSDGTHPTILGSHNDAAIIKTYLDPLVTSTKFRRIIKIGT